MPAATPVSMPDVAPIVAVPVAPELQLPAEPVLDSVIVLPGQTEDAPVMPPAYGSGFTVTCKVSSVVPHTLVVV